MYKRTGPFWQDTAGTVQATVPGQPVKRWTDTSGNGKHLIWSSGNVPTLRSGGGIIMPTGGAQLEVTVGGGTSVWSLYQTAIDTDTTDLGWSIVFDNPGTPLTGIGPSYNSTNSMAHGFGGSYAVAVPDTGIEAVRGIVYDGTNATSFVNTNSISGVIGGAIPLNSIRYGTLGGTFLFKGEIINGAIYSTADDATARGLVRTYLSTE